MTVDVLGAGIVSAAGVGLEPTWTAVLEGKDTRSDLFEETKANLSLLVDSESLQVATLEAVEEAITSAGLRRRRKIDAVCIGSSSDSVAAREAGEVDGPSLASYVAEELNVRTYYGFSNACASSSTAITMAVDMIQDGVADVVLAGGADEVTASSVDAFTAAGIYSDRCRPFDKNRTGLTLGDGAAFLVLAKPKRGVTPLATIRKTALCSDGEHMVRMSPKAVERVIRATLRDGGSYPDLIVAHGTGTKVNDRVESEAIGGDWGSLTVDERVVFSSLVVSYKGSLGHPQGASGAVGVVLAVKAMNEGVCFRNAGVEKLDDKLFVSAYVPLASAPCDLSSALVLSHGTWGVYSSILLESS